jgi:hypothetical protein
MTRAAAGAIWRGRRENASVGRTTEGMLARPAEEGAPMHPQDVDFDCHCAQCRWFWYRQLESYRDHRRRRGASDSELSQLEADRVRGPIW